MNWRVKAALQWGFSVVPRGESLNYWCQQYVTRSLPASDASLAAKVELARSHADAAAAAAGRPLADLTFYEFGAGWDLIVPIAYYGLGVRRQILVDIRPLLRDDLVRHALSRLPELMRTSRSFPPLNGGPLRTALREQYGIDYHAPMDARATGLPSGSVDVITSTSTLEHIPADDLASVLRECHRLLRPGGVMTAHVAYDDHYAASDPSITRHHFLQYSDDRWRLYNPPLHYQSRLRHSDYVRLLERSGFEIVRIEPRSPDADEEAWLDRNPVAERFRSYSRADLGITHGFFVLRTKAP